ncbi:MAG TPA: FAD-linked oxidase C-terminal domain-containing protein, partial [Polyangiaceae bacterium]|nr:FAD-linked oxidase C-terminal domain-containing protein [Polyangiaceae bacterium]
VGSEGTCALTLAATLRLVDDPPERRVVALGYEDVYTAADHVPEVLGFEPLAVEGMDRVLYDHVRDKHLPQRKYLDLLPAGNGWLLVELGSHHRDELEGRARRLCETLLALPRPPRQASIIDARDAQAHLWKVREAGLGATAFVPGRPDAWPGFEDSAVPPERLGAYLRDLRALFERYDYHPALYGHFGAGCVHCRVNFDLTTQGGIARYRAFMRDAVELCAGKYGGSISGEHGDGQARGELLQQMFGDELVGAFREFKSIWDPDGKMNPGRVVDARPLDRDLRLGAGYAPWQPPTHFRFPDDGGSMAHATLRCVGVGKCRRQHGADADDDTMCPSFMVTHEEKHSTRGRAHLLWEMMRNGATATAESWQDEAVKDALELCLSCKGCKGDCPVNVDIATYKAEFLSHYHAGKLRPRHAYAFGLIDRWARLAALAPGWVNLVTQLPGLRSLARVAAGITPERALPRFAPQTFRAWFEQRAPSPQHGQRVLLWPDTFNNYFYPDTARAAVRVLEQLGFQVAIPREILCCGRPLYDYGFLVRAKRYLERVLAVLAPELEAGTPIVVLEPSCCAVFRDELPALLPERADARKLAEQALLLSELVARRGLDGLPQLNRTALVQGHCHHKAVMRFEDESAVLKALGLDAEVLASGCCGLAGSFGFERDKYAVSHACGERVLFPRVRDASDQALIIADGFSCRTQIEHGTGRRALHLAEVMALAIDVGPEGPPRSERPETAWMAERDRVARRSMWRAAIGSALVLGMLLLARRKPRGRWPSR